MSKKTHAELKQIVRGFEFKPETLNDKARTVELVWTTGEPVLRQRWFDDPFYEVLDINAASIRMDRLNGGAPLLDAHSQYQLDNVLGVVEKAWLSGNEGRATVRFPKAEDDPEADKVYRKVKDGILRNVSVGYRIYKFKSEGFDQETGYEILRAIDWEPLEISLVPIGADASAGVRSADQTTNPVTIERSESAQGVNSMPKPTAVEPQNNQVVEPVAQAPESPVITEPTRSEPAPAAPVAAPSSANAVEILEFVASGKLTAEQARSFLEKNTSIADVRKEVINSMATKNPVNPTISAGNLDETETLRTAVEDQISLRLGLISAPTEIGKRMHGLSLIEMGRILTGVQSGPKSEVAARSLSSSDFPNILQNVAHKQLMKSYNRVGKFFEAFVKQGMLVDYKPAYRYQTGDAPSLSEVKEGAEYTYGSFGEKAESIQLKDYGKILKFTRQMMINDDLSAFDRIIGNFGSTAARLENSLVAAIFNSNPTMGDSVALFHASHANLGTTGAPSETTLKEMEKLLMDQLSLDGLDYLGLTPKYILSGTAKKVEIQKLITSIIPNQASSVSVYQGALQQIVAPQISGNKFFLISDPAEIDHIEVSHLEGENGPVIDSKDGWNSDGVEIKCRHTVAAKALEWKGMTYNVGA